MTDAVRRPYGLRHQRRSRSIGGVLLAAITAVLLSLVATTASFAEEPVPDGPPSGPWGPGLEKRKNTTTVERGKTKGPGLRLVALLTGDGQQIDQGLVWRVFQTGGQAGKSKLLVESHEASPFVKLQPGEYRVSLTLKGHEQWESKLKVAAGEPATTVTECEHHLLWRDRRDSADRPTRNWRRAGHLSVRA